MLVLTDGPPEQFPPTAESTSLPEALMRLGGVDGERFSAATTTLDRLLSNIVSHPHEDKFRHVKISNATLKTKVCINASRQVTMYFMSLTAFPPPQSQALVMPWGN